MGSELVIVRWCDRCKTKGDDVVEHRVRVDDLDRQLDLCPACYADTIAAVVEAISDLGQPADKQLAPPAIRSARVTPSGRPSPGKGDADRRCKLCSKVAPTSNAMWQHAKQVHDMLRDEYRAAAVRPESALGQGVAA